MNDNSEKYVDPAQNPLIKVDPDDDVPSSDEEDVPSIMDPEGTGMPPIEFGKKNEADSFRSLDLEAVKLLVEKDAGMTYIYGSRYYDPSVSMREKLDMNPLFALEKTGDNISVKRAEGNTVLTAEEIDLIRKAIEAEKE
jgi:hypothetical protein